MRTNSNILISCLHAMLCLLLVSVGCKKTVTESPDQLDQQQIVLPFQGVDQQQIERILNAMTLEEKLGQMLVIKGDGSTSDEIYRYVTKGNTSGFILNGLAPREYINVTDSLQRLASIPLFFGTEEDVSLHNQLAAEINFPSVLGINAVDSPGLVEQLETHFLDQCNTLGINLVFNSGFDRYFDAAAAVDLDSQNQKIQQRRILPINTGFDKLVFDTNDSLREIALHPFLKLTRAGLAGIGLAEAIFLSDTLQSNSTALLGNYLSDHLDFNGLSVVQLLDGESPELKLLQGAQLIVSKNPAYFFEIAYRLLQENKLSENDINDRVRNILKAKSWLHGGRLPVILSVVPRDSMQQPVRMVSLASKQAPRLVSANLPKPGGLEEKIAEIECYFNEPSWKLFADQLHQNSIVLASDTDKLLPVKSILDHRFQIFEMQGSNFKTFRKYFAKYADFQPFTYQMDQDGNLSALNISSLASQMFSVVLLDSLQIKTGFDGAFYHSINELAQATNVVLVNFGDVLNLKYFDPSITFIQAFDRNEVTERHIAQAIFGGASITGKLPTSVSKELPFAATESIPKIRIGHTSPREVGVAEEKLVGIDAIAKTAIQNRVFPGCQVVVAKNGNVIYSKSFGYHTYSKNQPVENQDVYDLASVSKITATTLGVMKLYDQSRLNLSSKISDYVSLDWEATVKNVQLRNLLIHYSGLQAPMPIAKFFNWKNVPRSGCNDIFCKQEKEEYETQIASNLYFRSDYQDTIWSRVANLNVSTRPTFPLQ